MLKIATRAAMLSSVCLSQLNGSNSSDVEGGNSTPSVPSAPIGLASLAHEAYGVADASL